MWTLNIKEFRRITAFLSNTKMPPQIREVSHPKNLVHLLFNQKVT